MEIIKKNGQVHMKVVYESPIEEEGTQEWLFKEMMCADFIALDVTPKLVEGKTLIGQHTVPIIFMLNTMMVEGEPITDETPYRVFGYLKMELNDFLA